MLNDPEGRGRPVMISDAPSHLTAPGKKVRRSPRLIELLRIAHRHPHVLENFPRRCAVILGTDAPSVAARRTSLRRGRKRAILPEPFFESDARALPSTSQLGKMAPCARRRQTAWGRSMNSRIRAAPHASAVARKSQGCRYRPPRCLALSPRASAVRTSRRRSGVRDAIRLGRSSSGD